MKIMRTPDDRFADLPDYDFEPNYREVTADDGTALAAERPRPTSPSRRRPSPTTSDT